MTDVAQVLGNAASQEGQIANKGGYRPTCDLRFIKRRFSDPHYPVRTDITVQVLQQRWTSDHVGYQDQWRDVPFEAKDGQRKI